MWCTETPEVPDRIGLGSRRAVPLSTRDLIAGPSVGGFAGIAGWMMTVLTASNWTAVGIDDQGRRMTRTSGRRRWIPAAAGVLAVSAALLVGCTTTQPQGETFTQVGTSTVPAAASTPAAPESAVITIAPGSCPDVSGRIAATVGMLSMGPFVEEELRARQKGATVRKLWVASQREGMDEAILTLTDPDGVHTRQTRPSGRQFIPDAKQFYAGGIDIGRSGPYRIDLTVGPDTMCVVAVYE